MQSNFLNLSGTLADLKLRCANFLFRRKIVFLFFGLFVALSFNLYFRLYPAYFPQLKTRAKQTVLQQAKQSVFEEVMRRFPQFYPIAKERIVENQFKLYLKANSNSLKKSINELYKKMKEAYQDPSGQTYLMELDCWHWARYTENVVEHGYPGDEIIGGRQFDTYMLSPLGMKLLWNKFLFYFSGYLYKIVHIFLKDLSLFTFLFYLPLFFMAILTTVLYLFNYRLGGVVTAFIATIVSGMAPIFIPRSCAGWFDTDILNLLFPVLVIWTYLKSTILPEWRRAWPWIIFSGFWVGVFCFTWISWWFVFVLVILYEVIWLVYLGIVYFLKGQEKDRIKRHLFSAGLFLAASLIWVVVFCGLEPLEELLRMLGDALILNRPLLPSIWPNVFATVGELRRSDFKELANSLGGLYILLTVLVSGLVLLLRILWFRAGNEPYKRNTFIMFLLWFLAMLFASLRGVRFAVFLSIPSGVFIGMFIQEIRDFFRASNQDILGKICVYILAFAISISTLQRAHIVSSSIFPLMDRQWNEVLTIIREKTPQDSVINSWWDFGDWFKVVGRRRVIFDGQSQKGQLAYWMARVLLTDNEEEAVAILRMLNNSSEEAFRVIDKVLNDPVRSALLLERLMKANPKEAKDILKDTLPEPIAQQVFYFLYNSDKNAYFVVDASMISKISAISYLGNWNFVKVYILHNIKSLEKNRIIENLLSMGKERSEVERYFQESVLLTRRDIDSWLSQSLQFYSPVSSGQQKGDLVYFDNGFIYNSANQTLYTNSQQVPRALFVAGPEDLKEFVFANANLGVSALVYKNNQQQYRLVLLDRQLARSIFVRLYFLNGLGLKHFKAFIDAQRGNDYVRVFRIIW